MGEGELREKNPLWGKEKEWEKYIYYWQNK